MPVMAWVETNKKKTSINDEFYSINEEFYSINEEFHRVFQPIRGFALPVYYLGELGMF